MIPPGRELLLDIIKGSIASLALFLAFVTLPMIGLFPGMFAPLPAIWYSLKRGKVAGGAIVVITSAVLALIAEPATVAIYLLQSGSLSIALPFFLSGGKGGARSLAYSVVISLALVLAAAFTFSAVRGVNLDRQVQDGIKASIAQTSTFYEKAGLKGEELKTLQEGLTQAGGLIARIYPAMLIVTLIVVAGANMLALAQMSARLSEMPQIGSFRAFSNPEPLVWALIAAGFAMLLPQPAVTRIAINVLIVIVFMYFLQGLAVVIHLLGRLSVPPFLRGIFYILLAVQPYLAVGVAVLGIFDIWGNFRNPKTRQNL